MVGALEVKSKIRGEQKKRIGTAKSTVPIGNRVVNTRHPGKKIGRWDSYRTGKIRRGSTNGG